MSQTDCRSTAVTPLQAGTLGLRITCGAAPAVAMILVTLILGQPAAAEGIDAVTAMLAAAQRGDEMSIERIKSQIDAGAKPARGDGKAARAHNDAGLKLLKAG